MARNLSNLVDRISLPKTEVILDLDEFEHAKQALESIPKAANRVLARALNTATNRGFRRISQELSKVVALPQKDIRKGIRKTKATYSRLYTTTRVRARRLGLIRFKHKEVKRRGVGGGVRVTVFRGNPEVMPHAFIAKGKGGQAIFERAGRARLPITVKRAPSMARILREKTIGEAAIAHGIQADFADEVRRGIRFELLRAQGKIVGQSTPRVTS